jgi:hypothetical protein
MPIKRPTYTVHVPDHLQAWLNHRAREIMDDNRQLPLEDILGCIYLAGVITGASPEIARAILSLEDER